MNSARSGAAAGVLIASGFGDAVSGGGLFRLQGSQVERIDSVSSMGMAFDGRRLARILRCAPQDALLTEVVLYDERGATGYLRIDEAAATHDVVWDDGRLVIVSPWYNAVRWFSTGGELLHDVRYPGPVDAWHINCITRREGVWYATMFGDFGAARGWSVPGRVAAAGRLVELKTGRVVAEHLSSPHTPRWLGDHWVVCNSDGQQLVAIDDRSGRIVRHVDCGGWTRGVAYDDEFFYVGACRRRATREAFGNAHIVVVDRRTWEPVDRIPVPVLEIYELQFVPEALIAGLERGFDVNPMRSSEFRQHRIFAELGVEQPRRLWPSGEPLPWSDFRCKLACTVPARYDAGDLLKCALQVTNQSESFFASAPPAPVFASYKWLDPETGEYLSEARAYRSPLPRTLFPGESLEMTVTVVVPPRAGPALLRITLMQEGVSWFDDQDPSNALEFLVDLVPAERDEPAVPIVR